jgi:uroporphyrinogen decarboxylase
MHGAPELWRSLMECLAASVVSFLRAQVDAGAQAVQLFDSWSGTLTRDDYERHALPWVRTIVEGLSATGAPRIVFGVATGELLDLMAGTGADVVGVDWRVPLDAARGRVGGAAVQGNLDPAACLAPWDVVAAKTRDVLAGAGDVGHVFNLGHGVLPETDPDVLKRIVDLVHEDTARG